MMLFFFFFAFLFPLSQTDKIIIIGGYLLSCLAMNDAFFTALINKSIYNLQFCSTKVKQKR